MPALELHHVRCRAWTAAPRGQEAFMDNLLTAPLSGPRQSQAFIDQVCGRFGLLADTRMGLERRGL